MAKKLDRVHQVSVSMLNRYRILRLLYHGPLTYEELESMMPNMEPRTIIRALGKLLNNQDIKKEKMPPVAPTEITTESVSQDLLGLKQKQKFKYLLLDRGRKKCFYWDYRFQCYTKLSPGSLPWNESFNEQYYQDASDYIKKSGLPTV